MFGFLNWLLWSNFFFINFDCIINFIRIISAANRGYHAMSKMFTSEFLPRDTKKKLHIAYLRPIVMYECKTWPTMLGDENKLLTFDKKIFRKIYGPKPMLNSNTGVYERRKNADSSRPYNVSNLQDFLRSKRLKVGWSYTACRGWID